MAAGMSSQLQHGVPYVNGQENKQKTDVGVTTMRVPLKQFVLGIVDTTVVMNKITTRTPSTTIPGDHSKIGPNITITGGHS